jgi:hypothetical protein
MVPGLFLAVIPLPKRTLYQAELRPDNYILPLDLGAFLPRDCWPFLTWGVLFVATEMERFGGFWTSATTENRGTAAMAFVARSDRAPLV